jgi:hypothetical protein
MNLKKWADAGRIQEVVVTKKTLDDLKRLIDRDLADSKIAAVSNDRRFATAYNAALNLASFVIRQKGYRVSAKIGHHQLTFELAGEIIGASAYPYVDFFDLCRRKRNKVDYDLADVVSESEVVDLIEAVLAFKPLAFGTEHA